MSFHRFRPVLLSAVVCSALVAPVFAVAQAPQSTASDASAPTTSKDQDALLKDEEKANKQRAKAAKEQRKALRAQDKAAKAEKKAGHATAPETAAPASPTPKP